MMSRLVGVPFVPMWLIGISLTSTLASRIFLCDISTLSYPSVVRGTHADANLAGDRPRGGKCVRLQQGDYNRETVFGDDPVATARRWVAEGAEYLHLVDLDGHATVAPRNLPSVQAILAAVDVPCELGGGIRDEAAIQQLLEAGLSRLVIGTLRDASLNGFVLCAASIPAYWC